MKFRFTKMHGIGNDYIYISTFKYPEVEQVVPELAVKMSPRHHAVGSDGIILICPSSVADAKMRMFNADGSEGKMCGNGIRCVGKYVWDNRISRNNPLKIETLSGVKTLNLNIGADGLVASVAVDMGRAELDGRKIPVALDKNPIIGYPLTVEDVTYPMTCVSMGNPHAVTFLEEIDALPLEKIGPKLEHDALFPERVNTEFVRVIDRQTLQMRVWERGSGETFACGTGACATVVAAILNGYCDYDAEVTVRLLGGELKIVVKKDLSVTMTGPAETVYEGTYEY